MSQIIQIIPFAEGEVLVLKSDGTLWLLTRSSLGWRVEQVPA